MIASLILREAGLAITLHALHYIISYPAAGEECDDYRFSEEAS
jgi:hypothetical protein